MIFTPFIRTKRGKKISLFYYLPKVVFRREIPQKNVVECLFSQILQDTIFCKMAKCTTLYVVHTMYLLTLILSQIFLYIAHCFSEIIPFPVQLPLKHLERNL